MIYIDAALMGLGLAMDAAAVSMANGLKQPNMRLRKILAFCLSFALFQGVMPLIGYAAGSLFRKWVSQVTPYVALVILCVLGIKMIIDGIKGGEEDVKPLTATVIIVQAFATSIDALTVGVVYVGQTITTSILCFAIISIVTLGVTLLAVWIGKKVGTALSGRAVILGGCILIAIGLKIFIEYLVKVL